MTDRELMKQALDALIDAADSQNWEMQQNINQHGEWYRRSVYLKQATAKSQETVEALRARLAQPEPLPAKSKGALSHEENKQHNKKILDKFYEENAHLYTAPSQREWQGLTDEEIMNLIHDVRWQNMVVTTDYLARAIEAKLKEKNNAI